MKCETCGITHDGSYGSGRFCTMKCARSFATSSSREEITKKVSKALKARVKTHGKWGGQKIRNRIYKKGPVIDWQCPVCDIHLSLTPSQAKKRKYCSGKCRNKINNLKHTGRRSKAELVLEQKT